MLSSSSSPCRDGGRDDEAIVEASFDLCPTSPSRTWWFRRARRPAKACVHANRCDSVEDLTCGASPTDPRDGPSRLSPPP